ncbi:hypothetical protein CTA2_4734 [Colletotrichum tanaceti]|uniref:Uncharacterized protein n=1 Tax=Colletotrichum tanaceti TaxID=1306861 RepID=A0A4U6X6Q9_9PEZI|nr:hypothetical protein CTA2_4723 [Colletotrichum tanaceti]KAJ0167030.1 hypothetical protein CTA2_4734 [Colletotrichum tanaceti]TKW51152.1 hypothetical protein CTA1_12699 [Colletotrichum tanaceti]
MLLSVSSEPQNGPRQTSSLLLASDMYSENLMRMFGLYHWSHVGHGFGSERATLLGYSVLRSLLFEITRTSDLALAEVTRDRDGMLPLHVAALRGHTCIVEAILSANRHDVEYVERETSQSGQAALSLSIAYPETDDTAEFLAGHPDVDSLYFLFRILLSNVPEGLINAINENGETPLHMLPRHGDHETLEAALRVLGVETNLEAEYGPTPLVNAVMEARADAVQVLAVRGDANVAAMRLPLEPLGVSALEYATQILAGDGGRVEHAKVLRFLRGKFV